MEFVNFNHYIMYLGVSQIYYRVVAIILNFTRFI